MKKKIQKLKEKIDFIKSKMDKKSWLLILGLFGIVIVVMIILSLLTTWSANTFYNDDTDTNVVCDVSNESYQSYISWYESQNPTYVLFSTQDEAESYMILLLENGFTATSGTNIYQDNECTIETYYVVASTTEGLCADSGDALNSSETILAADQSEWLTSMPTINEYLESLGYICPTEEE